MICPFCGNEIENNAKFCTKCGADLRINLPYVQPPVQPGMYPQDQSKSAQDKRLYYVLAVLLGFVLYRILVFIFNQTVAASLGVDAMVSYVISTKFLNLLLIITLIIEGIFMLCIREKRAVSMTCLLIGMSAEVLILIVAFAFPVAILKLFAPGVSEIAAYGILFLRSFAAAALVSTASASLFSYFVKKDSILLDVVILGAVSMLSLILGFLSLPTHTGLRLIGISLGLLHPMVVIIPWPGKN